MFAAFSAAFFAVFGLLPAFLSERMSVDTDDANALTAIAVAASAFGNLVCGHLLIRGVGRSVLMAAGFGMMALCGYGILGLTFSLATVTGLAVVFSFASGLVPVVLFGAVPGLAPRADLGGATMGFLMQGNNIGMLAGPAIAGSLVAGFRWPAVSLLVAALSIGAIALGANRLSRADDLNLPNAGAGT